MLQALFEPVTNREDWIQQCEVRDQDDNLFDLTGCTIVMVVRERKTRIQRMIAQTTDGSIVIQSAGVFQFTFPLAQMHGLDVNVSYEVGCTIKLPTGVTQQFFVGSVPLIDGIVP